MYTSSDASVSLKIYKDDNDENGPNLFTTNL